VRIMAGLDGLF